MKLIKRVSGNIVDHLLSFPGLMLGTSVADPEPTSRENTDPDPSSMESTDPDPTY